MLELDESAEGGMGWGVVKRECLTGERELAFDATEDIKS